MRHCMHYMTLACKLFSVLSICRPSHEQQLLMWNTEHSYGPLYKALAMLFTHVEDLCVRTS